MIKPQQEYRLGYDRHGVKFDLTWTAVAEPHYMKLAKSGDENPGIKNWVAKDGDFSVGHYEHAGRFTGTVEIEGEVLEINCGALRDRGWGPRHADVKDPFAPGGRMSSPPRTVGGISTTLRRPCRSKRIPSKTRRRL
jgi:hypothetical protein